MAVDDRADELALLGQVEADQPAVGEGAAEDAFDRGLDVPEHLQLLVEELREEHRHLVVRGSRSSELAAEVTALGRGVRPVLDPAQAPRGRIRVLGDVADRVDVGERRPEVPVHDDPVVDVCARSFRELDVRLDADPDDREIALERPAVR